MPEGSSTSPVLPPENTPLTGPGRFWQRFAPIRWTSHWGPWPGRVLGGLALFLVGVAAGLIAVRYGLVVPLGTLAGLALAVVAFFSPWTGLLLATTSAILLPFAVLPVSLGLTPSFLELILLGTAAGWLLPPLLRGDRRWHFLPLDALAWGFVAMTLFALLLGLGRGVDATVLHNYGKTTLGLLAFFGVRQLARREGRLRQFLAVFLLAAGLAALLGLALYFLPDRTAQGALEQLGALGYPVQGRVLRYVEDDPNGLERAIGTSVDPNSFGGMLALAAAVTLGEVLGSFVRVRDPDVWVRDPARRGREVRGMAALLAILALLLLCLYLTYSRAALGGFLAAAIFLATARYRRLWWGILPILVLLVALVAGLGGSNPVAERFRQGLAFQDLANRMRLAEFANAAAIVQRYPVFGVGFGHSPEVDLSTGVSSIYLTIAERMGLAGLLSFLAFVGAALVQGLRAALQRDRRTIVAGPSAAAGRNNLPGLTIPGPDAGIRTTRLALLAGVVAALVMGLLDHYFFNLEFPHMVALLWTVLGLATVAG